MWGKKRGKEKEGDGAFAPDKGDEWLNSFEKEMKDYYRKNPEKISEFFERGMNK